MADTSVATIGAPVSGSGAEFASQGEDSWDDEFDVGKSAGHSTGSIATGLAYLAYHSRMLGIHAAAHATSLVLAAGTYFLANTAPVASIIGLTEGGNPLVLWHKVFLWSFPNYVIGAGLTAIVSAFSTISGLATVAGLMTVLFAVYQSYKTYVGRAEQSQSQAMAMAAGR